MVTPWPENLARYLLTQWASYDRLIVYTDSMSVTVSRPEFDEHRSRTCRLSQREAVQIIYGY